MDRHRYNKRLVNRRARARKAKKKLQGKQGIDPGQASTAQGSIDPDSLESVSTGTDTRLGNSENNTYSPGVDTTANEEPYTIDSCPIIHPMAMIQLQSRGGKTSRINSRWAASIEDHCNLLLSVSDRKAGRTNARFSVRIEIPSSPHPVLGRHR
jgi:hypothetical protein